jgi:hypothetical protein
MSTNAIENWKYEYDICVKKVVLAKDCQSVWTEAQGVPYPGRPLFIQIY